MTNKLPKIYTQGDQTQQDVERWKNGTDRDRLMIMLSAFTSSPNLPITDDYYLVQKEATGGFQRNNYGEAQQYVDTLTRLVEFYKELAEKYLDHLTTYGIITNQYGDVTNYPFVLTQGGEQVLGVAEILSMEEHNSDSSLWHDYVKPYLQLASAGEREWIAINFPEGVEELEAEQREWGE